MELRGVKRRSWIPVAVLGASLCVSLLVGTLLMASHLAFRADEPALGRLASRIGGAHRSWSAIHVLAAGCACSRGVAEHLIERGPLPNIQESAVLVGHDAAVEGRLRSAKIQFTILTPDEAVSRYDLHGAPWLVFIAPGGDLRYAGGYSSERNVRDGYQDVRIWDALRRGEAARALPAYGCALGRRLQKRVDPLGLKYVRQWGISKS